MIELSTGYLRVDQIETEVLAVVDDLLAFGHGTVYVSCAFGCQRELLAHSQDVPVDTARLTEHLADWERLGAYELGDNDLYVTIAGIEFLFCHESDIHCSGEECPLLSAVRRRWTHSYEHSWERHHQGPWCRLARMRHGKAYE